MYLYGLDNNNSYLYGVVTLFNRGSISLVSIGE
jgi:hypothetical protein